MTAETRSEGSLVLVGNPFFPTGRGATVLGFIRSLRAVGADVRLCDAYSLPGRHALDNDLFEEMLPILVPRPGSKINIYHVNADEVDMALQILRTKLPDGAYNIIYPFWELSRYPREWIPKLKLFDEVWAPSRFIADFLRPVCSQPVMHMPMAVEVQFNTLLNRRALGLPESPYLFLFSFDYRSFPERKNPLALVEAFGKLVARGLPADVRLVIKQHGSDFSPAAQAAFAQLTAAIPASGAAERIIVIDRVFTADEMKNLIRCCDCYISLHRSEGFGLGLAEAMYLGKPVIGTAYSGNMDFMTAENSCLVDYELIPVQAGHYIFAEGQVWAEPNVEQAVDFMGRLVQDRDFGRRLGASASRHMRTHFSHLTMGLRYQARVQELLLNMRAS